MRAAFLDFVRGKLLLPLRTALPTTADIAEVVLVNAKAYLATTADIWKQILTAEDRGVPNGVAPLNAQGVVPAAYLGQTIGRNVGEVYDWAGDPLNIPADSLPCSGDEFLRTEFPALFRTIGTRFGRPSSDLYFKTPRIIDRVTYGAVCGSDAARGAVHKVNILTRGVDFTPGTTPVTFVGGTSLVVATGSAIVNAGGEIESIIITNGGIYTAIGDKANGSPSNCGITISGLGAGTGFTYEIQMRPAVSGWAVKITNRGSGYTTAYATISGTLAGATAVPVIASDGTIQEVIITNEGPTSGDPSTSTIGITGDGTLATASLVRLGSVVVAGDVFGRDQHMQLDTEVGPYRNPWKSVGGSHASAEGYNGTYGEIGNTYATQSAMPIRSPGVGLVKLIFAGTPEQNA